MYAQTKNLYRACLQLGHRRLLVGLDKRRTLRCIVFKVFYFYVLEKHNVDWCRRPCFGLLSTLQFFLATESSPRRPVDLPQTHAASACYKPHIIGQSRNELGLQRTLTPFRPLLRFRRQRSGNHDLG